MLELAQRSQYRHINISACQELYDSILNQFQQILDDNFETDTHSMATTSSSSGSSNGVSHDGRQTPNSELSNNNDNNASAAVSASFERYSQILQLLPCLRWFKQNIIVELFFSTLIGNLSIETVMPFILNTDIMAMFDNSQCTDAKTSLAGMMLHK